MTPTRETIQFEITPDTPDWPRIGLHIDTFMPPEVVISTSIPDGCPETEELFTSILPKSPPIVMFHPDSNRRILIAYVQLAELPHPRWG